MYKCDKTTQRTQTELQPIQNTAKQAFQNRISVLSGPIVISLGIRHCFDGHVREGHRHILPPTPIPFGDFKRRRWVSTPSRREGGAGDCWTRMDSETSFFFLLLLTYQPIPFRQAQDSCAHVNGKNGVSLSSPLVVGSSNDRAPVPGSLLPCC